MSITWLCGAAETPPDAVRTCHCRDLDVCALLDLPHEGDTVANKRASYMKMPIGIIARFALNRIVIPAIGKAIASSNNALTKEAARQALDQKLQDEARRRLPR